MFYQKRRNLIMEERDVTFVLTAINSHQGFFTNKYKVVKNCGWEKDPHKWMIRFSATEREWGLIAVDLSKIGEITVKVKPGGTTDLCVTRRES